MLCSLDLKSSLNAVSTSPDGSLAAVGGREVFKLISIEGNQLKESQNLRVGRVNLNSSVIDVKWHPVDGFSHLIATAATNGAVVLWNLNKQGSKQERIFTEHSRTVNRVCWCNANVNTLLSGSQDGTIKLWDTREGTCKITFNCKADSVRDLQFSPFYPNYFAAGFDNGSIQVWDIRQNKNAQRQISAHNGLVLSVAWHPVDRSHLASASRDKLIKIWDLNNPDKPKHCIQTIASVSRIAWRPNCNNQIASSAHMLDYNVHVWDLERPYVPQYSITEHKDVISGFLWYKGSSDLVLSCSKDCKLNLSSLQNAQRPAANVPTVALAWNNRNEMASVADPIDRNYQAPVSRPLITKLETPKNNNSNTGIIKLSEEDESENLFAFNANKFRYFAENYWLFDRPIRELCSHNEKVAKKIKRFQIAKVWSILGLYHEFSSPNSSLPLLPSQTLHGDNRQQHVRSPHQVAHSNAHHYLTGGRGDYANGNFGEDGDHHHHHQQTSNRPLITVVDRSTAALYDNTVEQLNTPPSSTSSQFLSANPASLSSSSSGRFFASPNGNNSNSNSNNNNNGSKQKRPASAPQYNYPPPPVFVPVVHPPPPPAAASTNNSDGSVFNNILAQFGNNSSSVFVTFENIVYNMLDFYSELGDVQTCVAIYSVFRDTIKFDEQRVQEWYFAYIDMLRSLRLWSCATYMTKKCTFASVNQMNQQSTSIYTTCGQCMKPLLEGPGLVCKNCKSKTNICALCHLPAKGLFIWCHLCGHGGHHTCMTSWFSKYDQCPACARTVTDSHSAAAAAAATAASNASPVEAPLSSVVAAVAHGKQPQQQQHQHQHQQPATPSTPALTSSSSSSSSPSTVSTPTTTTATTTPTPTIGGMMVPPPPPPLSIGTTGHASTN